MNTDKTFFIEILVNNSVSRKIELTSNKTIIGRHPSCTIQVGSDNFYVSNKHANIIIDNNMVYIEDLKSTNHVYVNGKEINRALLNHNDIIRFGTKGPLLRLIIQNYETAVNLPQNSFSESLYQIQDTNSADTTNRIPEISGNDILFDVSPEVENHNLPQSYEYKQITKGNTDRIISDEIIKELPEISNDNHLFDISPSSDNIEFDNDSQINNTINISSRLQKQLMNTQDIDILVKNQKIREKILNDKNVCDQQKQIISKVTNAYSSMKRKLFLVSSTIITLLIICVIWFAYGYFNYKYQLSKARSLKNRITTFDELFEKARFEEGSDNNKMATLYNQLLKVQTQFDSVKATLELEDQRKIYSDTVEVFLGDIMDELNEKNYSIPQHMLERVKYYIDLFSTQKRKATEILFRRKDIYFPDIEKIFSQKKIPSILAYVAMQESLLDTQATSSAGAVGMWQFMKSTGTRFGLVINDSTDERLNWNKSTLAAANYFRSLLLQFGDGRGALLAIAAYNAGEEKIKKALQNVENPIKDRDFWYLYRTSSILAMETREYVPQILARIIIDRHPDLYGFAHINAEW